jgi:hypothetical protein
MEQDLLLLQDQAGGMDIVAADRWVASKKKDGPSMSRTCGCRDMISLVIPRIGDNTTTGRVVLRLCGVA